MAMFPSQLLLSSKHLKEQILQPLFEAHGVELFVPLGFDTDQFGTFCGITPRIEGPRQTVKEKCLAGMAFANKRQGLASEGSFGPHPASPFLSINEEWLIYIDLDQNLEIYGHSVSMDLCHQQLDYRSLQLRQFLTRIQFGAQGLVLKDANSGAVIAKGLTNEDELLQLLQKHPQWILETDLRAHMNPKRQQTIAAAGKDLLQRMSSYCPKCAAPDFSVVERGGQLPCSWCKQPTQTHALLTFYCAHCRFQSIENRKDLMAEDPQYCQHCNP
jgi:hypothetical protein